MAYSKAATQSGDYTRQNIPELEAKVKTEAVGLGEITSITISNVRSFHLHSKCGFQEETLDIYSSMIYDEFSARGSSRSA